MNKYWDEIKRNRTLIVVEGEHEKDNLIKMIIRIFPELSLNFDNVLVYGADIYDLYQDIIKEYEEDWDENGCEIDIPYLISKRLNIEPKLDKRNFTNIIMMFDYERHDSMFDFDKISRLQKHFINVSDEGILYINYPMIESYLDMKRIPDIDYLNKKISVNVKSGEVYKKCVYKASVLWKCFKAYEIIKERIDSRFKDLSEDIRFAMVNSILSIPIKELSLESIAVQLEKFSSDTEKNNYFKHFIPIKINEIDIEQASMSFLEALRHYVVYIARQNILKAYSIQNGECLKQEACRKFMYADLDFYNILEKQNELSKDEINGFIMVLNTCVTFLGEYKFFWQ